MDKFAETASRLRNVEGIERPETWKQDGLTYTEMIFQRYAGNEMFISAGFVEGHDVDKVYFRLEKNGNPDDEVFVILRLDEMVGLLWCCSGVIWSEIMRRDFPSEGGHHGQETNQQG